MFVNPMALTECSFFQAAADSHEHCDGLTPQEHSAVVRYFILAGAAATLFDLCQNCVQQTAILDGFCSLTAQIEKQLPFQPLCAAVCEAAIAVHQHYMAEFVTIQQFDILFSQRFERDHPNWLNQGLVFLETNPSFNNA